MKALRAAFGDAAQEIGSGCCGMAGSFGHEREHYDVAKAVGEERLLSLGATPCNLHPV
jgi:Fe-S oxidoreductase